MTAGSPAFLDPEAGISLPARVDSGAAWVLACFLGLGRDPDMPREWRPVNHPPIQEPLDFHDRFLGRTKSKTPLDAHR
jgi:hypothetical protein